MLGSLAVTLPKPLCESSCRVSASGLQGVVGVMVRCAKTLCDLSTERLIQPQTLT